MSLKGAGHRESGLVQRLRLQARRRVVTAARRRNPALFEVNDISPPPESLGVHSLPPVRV